MWLLTPQRSRPMIRLFTVIALFSGMFVCSNTRTIAQPTPRAPIGPREFYPGVISPQTKPEQLPSNSIRIVNRGNQPLTASFWNSDEWQEVSINSGQPVTISCSKCHDEITVAFHNGREERRVKVNFGASYVFSWSDQRGVWVLTPLFLGR